MSSTSSGEFCMILTAVLNETPSRLILFTEMSRPPGLIFPALSAGPPGITEAIKMPRSNFPTFSPPIITKPAKMR